MARKLPKRLVAAPTDEVQGDDPVLTETRKKHASGDGLGPRGAWAQASNYVTTGELSKLQKERIDKFVQGDLVVEIDPSQISDEVGSDRNTDWKTDAAFVQLKSSIRENGQDVPIQIQPIDKDWVPTFDEANGLNLVGAKFLVISGRRRLEVARVLGQPVRAVVVNSEGLEFDLLHRRFRENVERENLSLFDELLSIGEMFSHEKTFGEKMTGRALAKRLGVSEPKVSKGRAVFDNQKRIFHEVEDPQSLTLHQIDALIPALRGGKDLPKLEADQPSPATGAKKPSRVTALKRTQIINGKKIVAKARGGKITLDMGADQVCDEMFLDRLMLFVQSEKAR